MYLDEIHAKARHIPYKGVGPMVTDLIGGQVEFGTVALPSVQGHLKSGALRAIGMATKERVAAGPDIPTFAEQGVPGYVVEAWFAVIGPKGMAPAEVKRIHDAVVTAFAQPEVKETMAKQGQRHQRQQHRIRAGFLPLRTRKVRGPGEKARVELQ